MNIFFEVKDSIVNVAKVKAISLAGDNAVRIEFDDGFTDVCSTHGGAERALEELGRAIVQLVPCAAPMYNVYKNNDGSYYYHERVYFLALCVDGAVRSLAAAGSSLTLADGSKKFVGYYAAERLKEFPASVNQSV